MVNEKVKDVGEILGGIIGGSTVAAGATLGAKAIAGSMVPWVCSTTGTVVAGVGTIQSSITPIIMSFAATGVGAPVMITGAVIGGIGVGIFKLIGPKL